MDVKDANFVTELKIKDNLSTARGCVWEYECVCTWPSSLLQSLLEGYRGILFVPTLIARSGQRKPCNPTAITTRLIDSIGTEREREREQTWREREVKR